MFVHWDDAAQEREQGVGTMQVDGVENIQEPLELELWTFYV